jgi:outer membrane protein assembly factor BamA
MTAHWRLSLGAALALSLFSASNAFAQDGSAAGTDTEQENASAGSDPDKVGFSNGSFIAVPIPFNDPTFGTGLVLGGGYLFTADEGSDTSFLGGGILGTDEDSYAIGLGGSVSFQNNRYAIFGFLGAADINYDLFILGQPVRIEQEGAAFQGEFRYGFTPDISAGVSVRYLESRLTGVNGTALTDELVDLTDASFATAGIVAQWDTRDDTIYPTIGQNLSFSATYTDETGGLDFEYARTSLGYDQFWSVGRDGVIAARVAGCAMGDRSPFFDSCLLGAELRGFSLFEFYGDRMLTAQAEYRGRFNERFGYVAFGGIGEVEKSLFSIDSGVQYAGGLGLRYRVSKEFGLDVSVDATLNGNGESLVYLYVGQGF